MKRAVLSSDPAEEYLFREGCHILELSNSALDSGLSVSRARVGPGVTTRLHRLQGVGERYLVLQGEGWVEVGDLGQRVGPGDLVLIPPGTPQRIRNLGETDLIFLALCTPRFQDACYQDMEED